MKRHLLFLALLIASVIGCGRSKPVARVTVSPKTILLRYPHCATVNLDWHALSALDRRKGRAIVFVHLLDGPHNLVRTFDHPLPAELTPNKSLKYDIEICQSALASPLRAATYELKIGLYDDEWGYRWPLETGGEETGRRGYRVAKVIVPTGEEAFPRFTFTGNWLPIESVESRQVLAHRWFTGSAAIMLDEIEQPGGLHVEIHVPAPGGLEIVSSCSRKSAVMLTRGDHAVDIALDDIQSDRRCRVEFRSGTENPKARARLNLASWLPATALPTKR